MERRRRSESRSIWVVHMCRRSKCISRTSCQLYKCMKLITFPAWQARFCGRAVSRFVSTKTTFLVSRETPTVSFICGSDCSPVLCTQIFAGLRARTKPACSCRPAFAMNLSALCRQKERVSYQPSVPIRSERAHGPRAVPGVPRI